MASQRMISRTGLAAAAAAAAALGGVGEYARRRRLRLGEARGNPARTPRPPDPPPLTTQSSPGQIADLQQAYGADMAPPGANGAAPR